VTLKIPLRGKALREGCRSRFRIASDDAFDHPKPLSTSAAVDVGNSLKKIFGGVVEALKVISIPFGLLGGTKAGVDLWQAWHPRFELEVERSAPVILTYDPRQKGLTLTCGLVITNRGTASDGIERANSDLRSTTDPSRHYVFGDLSIIFKDGPNQIPKNLPIQKDSGKATTCEFSAYMTDKLRELFQLHDTRRELIVTLVGHGQKSYSVKFTFDFGADIGPTLFNPSNKEPVILNFRGSDMQ